MSRKSISHVPGSQSWDGVAEWYAGWAGPSGSTYHKTLAIPLMMELLALRSGDNVADLGCGPGVLTPPVIAAGGHLTGIDLSPKLIAHAHRAHGKAARFMVADVTRLPANPDLRPGTFDAATFLLSLQDIDPLERAIRSAAWLLKPGGRLAIVMLHPCFRVPRQSGWGWDDGRALRYRRIDSYLTRLAVPMQPHGRRRNGVTRSYHRPLEAYFEAFETNGLALTTLREIADVHTKGAKADKRATGEFPLFLGLKAVKLE